MVTVVATDTTTWLYVAKGALSYCTNKEKIFRSMAPNESQSRELQPSLVSRLIFYYVAQTGTSRKWYRPQYAHASSKPKNLYMRCLIYIIAKTGPTRTSTFLSDRRRTRLQPLTANLGP